MENLIIKAKKEDINAKNEIIKAFTPLIISETKKVFIKNRNYEELIQMGITNLLHAIKLFDLSRDPKAFTAYAAFSIKNCYRALIRKEAKSNDELSIDIVNEESNQSYSDALIDTSFSLEETAINNILVEKLKKALNKLEPEELSIIKFLYIDSTSANLSKYARSVEKDYYYCSCLKKRALSKLKSIIL